MHSKIIHFATDVARMAADFAALNFLNTAGPTRSKDNIHTSIVIEQQNIENAAFRGGKGCNPRSAILFEPWHAICAPPQLDERDHHCDIFA